MASNSRAKRVFDSFCRNSLSRISGFSLRSPHSPKLFFPVCSKGNQYNTSYQRFYRFRGRDFDKEFLALGPWRFMLPVGVLVLTAVFHANSEYVPFWERIHFLNLSRNMELKIGNSAFKMVKRDRQTLPATDPSSLRVNSISQHIIEALQRGFGHDEQAWSDFRHDASTENRFGEETEGQTCGSNEILDDKRIEQSIKNQQKKSESINPHFEGIKWEVLVVDDPSVHAACLPGGKIVVFSGALKQYASDAELATIIAREVGHVVCRHTKLLWVVTLQVGVYEVIKKCFTVEFDGVKKTLDLFWRTLLSWKIDLEADKIAVLLMASAGYDPQVAVGVCAGFDDKVEEDGWLAQIIRDYLFSWTHPAGKKRAQRLAQAKEREDALIIYRGKSRTKA